MARFPPLTDEAFEELAGQVDAAMEDLTGGRPEPERLRISGLFHSLEHLHAEGWRRLWALAERTPGGREVLAAARADAVIRTLLLVYGLLEPAFEDRVELALQAVRPYLRSHGGDVEVVSVGEGVVRVRLLGACQGCPASVATLRGVVEQAITSSVPDLVGLEVVE